MLKGAEHLSHGVDVFGVGMRGGRGVDGGILPYNLRCFLGTF